MAKKKKRGKRQFTIPLAPTLGLLVGLAKPAEEAMNGNFALAIHLATLAYTGYNTQSEKWEPMHPAGLQKGILPAIIGMLIHKFVGGSPLNLNRMLAAAGVPVLRI